jgi:hypothetical protein
MLNPRTAAFIAAAFALSAFPAAGHSQDKADPQPAEPSDSSAVAEPGPVVEAEVTDFRTGLEVRDTKGGLVGVVESVDGEGAIVFTGNRRARLPFRSFGKNNLGLVISLSRAELEAAAAAQSPS